MTDQPIIILPEKWNELRQKCRVAYLKHYGIPISAGTMFAFGFNSRGYEWVQ